MSRTLPFLAGITFSSIFGFSFLFTRGALDYVEPIFLLGYRFLLGALLLTLFWLLGVVKLQLKGKKKGILLLLTLFQPILYFSFETRGVQLTSASESGLMISLIPIVVVLLAVIFLQERPSPYQLFFILLSVSGVVFIILMKEQVVMESSLTGYLYLGGAVLMGAIYNILSRYLSLKYKPVELTFIMMWSGALIFNSMALYRLQGDLQAYVAPLQQTQLLWAVLYLGVLSSVVAFFMINYTLSQLKAYQSAVFSNLTTIIAILAGVFLRQETFYSFQIIGGILIITGVFGTNSLEQRSYVKKLSPPFIGDDPLAPKNDPSSLL